MVLTGPEIHRHVGAGNIVIEPFDPARLNPNSFDISLGNTLLRYTQLPIDPRIETTVEEIEIPAQGLTLERGEFVLGCSQEVIGSPHFVPLIHAKSSIARAGLFVHVTADLIDIGSVGTVTFQLYPTLPLKVFPGMLIGQVSFWRPLGEIELYKGKYQNSTGPRKSIIFMDPFWGGK